jgi:putative ABC transport system substrate-binding protein
LAAVQQATRTVPVVFTGANEPVAQGFVQSLARPGGNITGILMLEPTVGAKWLELLKQIAPAVTRVAVMFNPEASPAVVPFSRTAQAAAQKFAVEVVVAPVHEPAEIEAAMAMLGREPGGGLIFPTDSYTTTPANWSSSWRLTTSCRRSMDSGISPLMVAWLPTAPISQGTSDRQQTM